MIWDGPPSGQLRCFNLYGTPVQEIMASFELHTVFSQAPPPSPRLANHVLPICILAIPIGNPPFRGHNQPPHNSPPPLIPPPMGVQGRGRGQLPLTAVNHPIRLFPTKKIIIIINETIKKKQRGSEGSRVELRTKGGERKDTLEPSRLEEKKQTKTEKDNYVNITQSYRFIFCS